MQSKFSTLVSDHLMSEESLELYYGATSFQTLQEMVHVIFDHVMLYRLSCLIHYNFSQTILCTTYVDNSLYFIGCDHTPYGSSVTTNAKVFKER